MAKYTNENFAGTRFGKLTAIRFSHMVRNSIAHWVFCCDCGIEKTIELSSVLRGHSTSCGCFFSDFISQTNSKHGHAKATRHGASPTYITWSNMIQRCKNGNDPSYLDIKVCDEWEDFEAFVKDMGERPPGKTLDRIDGSRDYYKDNCRWATRSEQSRNTRKRKATTSKYKGVSYLKKSNRWSANIYIDGKNKHLKSYKTEEEAALVYNRAASEYYGEFAVLNIIS